MRAAIRLAAVILAATFALAGCATSVLEMRPAAPGSELWGYRTVVAAKLGKMTGLRVAEDALASRLPGAISADRLMAGDAEFDEESEEDRKTWDTVVGIELVGSERSWTPPFPEEGWIPVYGNYAHLDFRVSVVRRADRKELFSMVVRSRAGAAEAGSFEILLDLAAERAAKELTKSGLFE